MAGNETSDRPTPPRLGLGRMIVLFGVLSAALLVALAIAPASGVFSEWRDVQDRFNGTAAAAGIAGTEVRIRQIWNEDLDVVDRCASCHVAMGGEAEAVAGERLFAAHPPIPHDPVEMGCTPCHRGQGRATSAEAAHGRVKHWFEPMLELGQIEAGCASCHSGLSVGSLDLVDRGRRLLERHDCLGCHRVDDRGGARIAPAVAPDLSGVGLRGVPPDWNERHLALRRAEPGGLLAGYDRVAPEAARAIEEYLRTLNGAPRLMAAKRLFLEKGCLGCHAVNGVGGDDGADLTRTGERPLEEYIFPAVWTGERSETEWHVRHLVDPGSVVPESTMPDLGLTREQAASITLYLLSLRPRDLPARWAPPDRLRVERMGGREFGTDGATLYRVLCVACHGADGGGRRAGEHGQAYPGVRNADLLAVASDDDLRRSIESGRTGRRMPAWNRDGGGLARHEIESIVAWLRAGEPAPAPYTAVASAAVDASLGRETYARECAVCHGAGGEGLIGPSHRSPAFGRLAGNRFLYETIVGGRPGTAMPGFSDLGAPALASVIAHVRGFSGAAAAESLPPEPTGDAERGTQAYAASCASCHGEFGEGGPGPGIGREGFLSVARPAFVVESYLRGRCRDADGQPTAPLAREVLRDVVARLPLLGADGKPGRGRAAAGDPDRGAAVYERACVGCHGENAAGASAPSLTNPGLLDAVADGFLMATIIRGRRGTSMPRFDSDQGRYPRLSAGDVEDVVSFIRRAAKEGTK